MSTFEMQKSSISSGTSARRKTAERNRTERHSHLICDGQTKDLLECVDRVIAADWISLVCADVIVCGQENLGASRFRVKNRSDDQQARE
jgi:hypothetical protein